MAITDYVGSGNLFIGYIGSMMDYTKRMTTAAIRYSVSDVPLVTICMMGITSIVLAYSTINDASESVPMRGGKRKLK